ncbi:DUF4870 domain-containing protein [Auraticoccus monumenti]|uniref:DUF4870 domain-containing protein n=1 Tax=Auraticoccus monumenti TaxID=675864 RepID=A0A1G6VA00_9ACTN|nr:DUF4870 domain-containing protein [Auraticoccus monumenti]SDD49847.1 protein of unknown function [Auraticoccus monumenti]
MTYPTDPTGTTPPPQPRPQGWAPVGPGHPAAPYAPAPPTGALSWWLGMLLLTLVPVISNGAAAVGAAVQHRTFTDPRDALAREVSRRAANFHLSLTLYTVLLIGTHILLLVLLSGTEAAQGFFPLGIAIGLVPVLGLYGLVLSVVSAVRASRGLLTPAVGAIPFFRR